MSKLEPSHITNPRYPFDHRPKVRPSWIKPAVARVLYVPLLLLAFLTSGCLGKPGPHSTGNVADAAGVRVIRITSVNEFCDASTRQSGSPFPWNDNQWNEALPFFNRGRGLSAQGRLAEAVGEFDKGLRTFPGASEETLFLATLHEQLGDIKRAESLLRVGIAMSAKYQRGEWVFCAGDALLRKSLYREAFAAWDQSLYPAGGGSLTDPRFADSGAEPLVRRGLHYAEGGDYAKARVEFGKAYNVDPTLQLPNFLLAATAYSTGNGKATRAHFVQTIQHPGLELPGQHGPDRIQIAAAALLLWVLQKDSPR